MVVSMTVIEFIFVIVIVIAFGLLEGYWAGVLKGRAQEQMKRFHDRNAASKKLSMRPKEIIEFIFADGVWTATCKDPSVFGQGKTPEEALTKVSKAIDSWLEYMKGKEVRR